MTNAFDLKNPIFKVDTKKLEAAASNSRTQSGVVTKKLKEGVQLALTAKGGIEPKNFYCFSKAGTK